MELKPCPFCGSAPYTVKNVDGKCAIGCSCDLVSYITGPEDSLDNLASQWNQRSHPGDSGELSWVNPMHVVPISEVQLAERARIVGIVNVAIADNNPEDHARLRTLQWLLRSIDAETGGDQGDTSRVAPCSMASDSLTLPGGVNNPDPSCSPNPGTEATERRSVSRCFYDERAYQRGLSEGIERAGKVADLIASNHPHASQLAQHVAINIRALIQSPAETRCLRTGDKNCTGNQDTCGYGVDCEAHAPSTGEKE